MIDLDAIEARLKETWLDDGDIANLIAEVRRLQRGHEVLNAALASATDDTISLQERLTRVIEGNKKLREREKAWIDVVTAYDIERDAHQKGNWEPGMWDAYVVLWNEARKVLGDEIDKIGGGG